MTPVNERASRLVFAALSLAVALCACGRGDPAPVPEADRASAIPASPLEVALEFSRLLALNDPACYELLAPTLKDSALVSGEPWAAFGRWRGFDASGRLTEILRDSTGSRTSYYCSIRRMEHPAIVRIDFVLSSSGWLIEYFGEEIPGEVIDSLSVERTARIIMSNPEIRFEMRVARQLLDGVLIDSVAHYGSLTAAMDRGTSFDAYIASLNDAAYADLAYSNIRRAASMQIIQDRATFNLPAVPVELSGFVAVWREFAFLSKAHLRDMHESMQILRATGEYAPPADTPDDTERLRVLRANFLAVSDLVERLDTLSTTFPAILTIGDEEPLEQQIIYLDPHQTEQRFENQIGMTVWRALGVEMNGDQDPERVVYFAGNLFLFEGTPTGYRLAWRTYADYESDYHSEFSSRPFLADGSREVTLIGNSGAFEYTLHYDGGAPAFGRHQLGSVE